jgi:hypothetical protein
LPSSTKLVPTKNCAALLVVGCGTANPPTEVQTPVSHESQKGVTAVDHAVEDPDASSIVGKGP